MKNYWQILGLEKGATQDEIKQAYKKYAKKFHPDLHQNDEFFKERFQEIQEAYEILLNQKSHSEDDEQDYSDYMDLEEPQIMYFTSSRDEVHVGDIITLSWEVLYAENVYIKNLGRQSLAGSKNIRINKFTNGCCVFELVASKHEYTTYSKICLKQADISNPKILHFHTPKELIEDKEQIMLYWDVKNAIKVTCSELGEIPLQGNQSVRIFFGNANCKVIYLSAYGEGSACSKKFIRLYKAIDTANLDNKEKMANKILLAFFIGIFIFMFIYSLSLL